MQLSPLEAIEIIYAVFADSLISEGFGKGSLIALRRRRLVDDLSPKILGKFLPIAWAFRSAYHKSNIKTKDT